MKNLHDANLTFESQTANSVTYKSPSNPQGKVLKDKLASLIAGDIGQERADIFQQFSDFSGYGPFEGFAENDKDLKISWEQQNGHTNYTIQNSYHEHGGGISSISSTTGSMLPPEYERLLKGN